MKITPGIYFDMTNEDYHLTDAISASFIKSALLTSLFQARFGKSDINKNVAEIGTSTHSEVLEPEKNNVVLSKEESRRTKAWKEEYERCVAAGKVLLTQKDYDLVQGMAHGVKVEDDNGKTITIGGVRRDPACAKLLNAEDRICEASIFVEHESGMMLKCRPDIFSKKLRIMGDLKTTQDCSPAGFNREIWKRLYYAQASFYLMVAELAKIEIDHFAFLAVQKTYPYLAHYHMLDSEAIQYGKRQVYSTLVDLFHAKQRGEYPTNWGDYTVHPLPDYYKIESED
tara:strand:+ start:687 stop:1538 length:852 start_codon:yes stop_codon:yes gene_type:complete